MTRNEYDANRGLCDYADRPKGRELDEETHRIWDGIIVAACSGLWLWGAALAAVGYFLTN